MEKHKESRHHAIIVLGKATHRGPEGHIVSPRGKEVLKSVARSYEEHRKAGHDVVVYFTGNMPNFTWAQRVTPLTAKHTPAKPQSHIFKSAAISEHGISEEHTATARGGSDLMQNLIHARDILPSNAVVEIHVDGYQSRRARMVADRVLGKHGIEYEIHPSYAPRNTAMMAFERAIYEPIESLYMRIALDVFGTAKNAMQEKVEFDSLDGTRLVGTLYKSRVPTDKCVILCHGIAGRKEQLDIRALANRLANNGISAFAFDFIGHGESGGRQEEMTLSKEKENLESAIAQMQGKYGFRQFGLVAFSFAGGAAELFLAEHPDRIKAAAFWSARFDFAASHSRPAKGSEAEKHLNREGYDLRGKGNPWAFRYGEAFFEDLEMLMRTGKFAKLGKYSGPLLIVHAENDRVNPLTEVEEAVKSMKNVQRLIAKESTAYGGHAFMGRQLDNVADEVTQFFTKEI